jgi:hypothetical protein
MKRLILILCVFLIGVFSALSYDKAVRNKVFYTINKPIKKIKPYVKHVGERSLQWTHRLCPHIGNYAQPVTKQ